MAAPALIIPARPLTWLITGTSSGFGLTLARYAQAGGHKVIASSRNPSKSPELVSEIESKGGKWITLDVTDPNSTKVINDLEASGTHVDILVNNAGFSIFCPVETTTEKEVRDQMEAMYFGPLRLIKALTPYWRQRKFGTIANISSGASLEGAPTMGPYSGAKAGLDGWFFPVLLPSFDLANYDVSLHPCHCQRVGTLQHSRFDGHPWHFQYLYGCERRVRREAPP